MGIAKSPPVRYTSSKQLIGGDSINQMNDQLYSTQSLVAAVGGGKANATQINSSSALITAAATAADSVKLPLGYAGLEVFVFNDDAANAAQIFGSGTDTINDVATGTGISLASQKGILLKCMVGPTAAAPAARWFGILSA